jgi:magnesium-protoporphyrin O-methyltransferase
VSNCCDPTPYRRLFNTKEAKRRLKRIRKKGLDKRAADVVAYLKSRGIEGMSLLEVGGGIGEIQLDLLQSGVVHATSVELSDAYTPLADELATETGVAEKIDRKFGDFVDMAPGLAQSDIVILNRVVCCYPFMEKMMGAATGSAGQFLGLVFPREKWWTKAGLAIGNTWLGFRKCGFRAFVHPEMGIESAAERAGLKRVHHSHDLIWHSVVYERTA